VRRAEAVVVLPQYPYVEVFGVWVLEALLLGAPVVTTRFGAVVESIEHGRRGLFVSSVDEPVQKMRGRPRAQHRRGAQGLHQGGVRLAKAGLPAPGEDFMPSALPAP